MLASTLRRLMLFELIIYCLQGWLLWRYGGWSPGWIVLLTLAIALAWRAYLVVFTFGYAWLYRPKRPEAMRIGPLRSVWLVLSEFLAFLSLYTLLQPAQRWFTGERFAPPPAVVKHDNLPVLLIHGYYCNAGFWWAMRRYLRRRGIQHVFTIDLEPVRGDIDHYATQIAAKVGQIRRLTGAGRVILVGYSMGGLAARAYVHRHGGQRYVARIITLASPHHGSALIRLSLSKGPNIAQMSPGNPWLADLNEAERQLRPTPITSIYSSHDNLVAPQNSPTLRYDHVNNITLSGIGHLAVTFSRPVQRLVYREILAASRISGKTLKRATVEPVAVWQDP